MGLNKIKKQSSELEADEREFKNEPRELKGRRCPKCFSTLVTNGKRLWCSFIGDNRRKIPACDYGITDPVELDMPRNSEEGFVPIPPLQNSVRTSYSVPFSPVSRIMLDLETWGNVPGSIIVAIGAVKFADNAIVDDFYTRVDPQSCEDAGLMMNVSTMLWWLKQDDAARLEITRPGCHLEGALVLLNDWIGTDADTAEMWGNGASFDVPVLEAAYKATGVPVLWKYWNSRCYRTVAAANKGIKMQRKGTAHNARDDARDQAVHLMEIEKARKKIYRP